MKVQFVTGTDDGMLGQTFILLRSFAACGADLDLMVCDFGLSPAARRLLERHTRVARIPTLPKNRQHPWYMKSAMVDFLPRDVEAVVWMDADMLVLHDPRPALAAILAEMAERRQTVAACRDTAGMSLQGYCDWVDSIGNECRPFRRLISQYKLATQWPLLNSGFFLAISRRWLKDYRNAAFLNDPYLLFEQCAFNTVAWRNPDAVRFISFNRWNLHGDALGRVVVTQDGLSVSCDDEPVTVLHCTSAAERHHLNQKERWELAGEPQSARLRLFRNPALQALQLRLFRGFLASG